MSNVKFLFAYIFKQAGSVIQSDLVCRNILVPIKTCSDCETFGLLN